MQVRDTAVMEQRRGWAQRGYQLVQLRLWDIRRGMEGEGGRDGDDIKTGNAVMVHIDGG